MRILFPLPIIYDGTEERYLQRDGARFAKHLVDQGHHAVKIIVDDKSGFDAPKSPLLDAARWEQWCSADYWKSFKADGILLYGGLDPRLEAVVDAISCAKIPVLLKMDSQNGVLPFPKDFWRLLKKYYHVGRQRHNPLYSTILSLKSQTSRAIGYNNKFLRRYLSKFDWITAETPYATNNTVSWLYSQHLPDAAKRTVLLPHPVPDEFNCFSENPKKKKQILAVASDWLNPLKGGKVLGESLAIMLQSQSDYSAIVVGTNSDIVKNEALKKSPNSAERITAVPLRPSHELMPFYRESQIFVTPSGSESGPIVAFEAICCGCSLVFPPELKQLNFCSDAGHGTIANKRTPRGIAKALVKESEAWTMGARNSVEISKTWTKIFHTSNASRQLLKLFSKKC